MIATESAARAPTVFISYSRRDRRLMAMVRELVTLPSGRPAFVDVESIRAGERWEEEIQSAVENCEVFVVIWSWRARDSDWVAREVSQAVAIARERPSLRIVPVLVDRTPLPPDLRAYQAITVEPESGLFPPAAEMTLTLLAGLGLLATSVLARVGHRGDLLLVAGLVSLWLGVSAFWALRAAGAPWSDTARSVGVLFGVIRIRTRALVVLLLSAILSSVIAMSVLAR